MPNIFGRIEQQWTHVVLALLKRKDRVCDFVKETKLLSKMQTRCASSMLLRQSVWDIWVSKNKRCRRYCWIYDDASITLTIRTNPIENWQDWIWRRISQRGLFWILSTFLSLIVYGQFKSHCFINFSSVSIASKTTRFCVCVGSVGATTAAF